MPQSIDRIRIAQLLRQGMRYADVAEEAGCSYRSVSSVAEEIGLARKQVSHKEALPWTLEERHKLSMPAQRLRDLSRLAQELPVDAHRKIGALRWAQTLIDEGLDISYEPDAPPSPHCPDGGFFTFPATTTAGRTHVGKWLGKATGKPVRRSARR
ncbi:helix-turn-helix domain-containing protein [Nonomuraea sp. NPDC052265]|uniref:helix-turn-helix domain-containing protein n=1 Tax=Nonomuraea sp. NPDC052265 TaxID=3364374 RepID=UPI0037CB6494